MPERGKPVTRTGALKSAPVNHAGEVADGVGDDGGSAASVIDSSYTAGARGDQSLANERCAAGQSEVRVTPSSHASLVQYPRRMLCILQRA